MPTTLSDVILYQGDCVERMAEIADSSIDAIICDPPYPHIKRPYGIWTEAEWWSLMMDVCRESRRVLKPTGSAVFVLQPNSRKVGSMRGWLWRFMAWACDEWNMVQDAWWWNHTVLPNGGANNCGLMRPSLKACVWLGSPECYRDQSEVLWRESDENANRRRADRVIPGETTAVPSGHSFDRSRTRAAAVRRGGTTPFNVLPIRGTTAAQSRASEGHPASTPDDLADWWVRYISPPSGVVCDPFMGSGTTGLAALNRGRSFVGIEKMTEYFRTAESRIAAARAATPLIPA